MNFGLNFQPGAAQTAGDQRSTANALGPAQRALKILALHLPRLAQARGQAPRPSTGLSPDAAVFQALVESLGGHPVGGLPTTKPLVDTLGQLPDSHLPSEWEPGIGELGPPTPDGTGVGGSGVIPPSGYGGGPVGPGDSPTLLGPNGEWQAGRGELGPPTDDPWASLMSALGG